MAIIHKLRDATARQASRLDATPGSRSRWLRRARQAGFVGATLLVVWELHVTPPDQLPGLPAILRVLLALLLYVVAAWPLPVAALSLVLFAAQALIGSAPTSSLVVLVPWSMTAVLLATEKRHWGYLYAAASVSIVSLVHPTEDPLTDLALWFVLFLIPCLIGEAARYMLLSVERIRTDSAEQLRRQRRVLARELHDTSIHDITSIIMALERAKLAGVDNPRALEEIDHAIATGRQSVVSMRGVLKILRSEVEAVQGREEEPISIAAAAPTVQSALDEARSSLARSGHELRVHVEDHIDQPLPFSIRTALVRVIQEGTANMVKYAAPGAPCTVMLERTDTETRALFINEAREENREDAALSSGLGLIGLRERVEAVGGTLAIRHHDGRWILQASIPTISSATEGQVERAAQH